MLSGKTIAITRSEDDASEFISLAKNNDANAVPLPTIELAVSYTHLTLPTILLV